MKYLNIIPKRFFFVSCAILVSLSLFSNTANAQRERVIKPKTKTKTVKTEKKTKPVTTNPYSRSPQTRNSGLTNKIIIKKQPQNKSLIKKTSSSKPTKPKVEKPVNRFSYNATTRALILRSIQRKLGIPYRLGTQGPYRYDCSGFIWKVFQESGIHFTRTSARHYWRTFKPAYGEERFKFGTLVFFNRLGHVGIVVDRNGFYHASSSRGVTYSKFNSYWSKRIVGYRRIPISTY